MGVNREIAEFVQRGTGPVMMPTVQSQKEQPLSEGKNSSAELPLPSATENQASDEIEKLDSLGSFGRLKAYTLDKFTASTAKLATGVSNLFSAEKRARGWLVVLQELNIFKYAVDGVLDPIFGVIDWGREELTCSSLKFGKYIGNLRYPESRQSTEVSYREFRHLEESENLLKLSKTLFKTAEVLLSLAATLASGGAAGGHSAVKAKGLFSWIAKEQPRFIALLNRLKISTYFAGVGAVSEELMQGENSDFNLERAIESTKVGMYYSLRFGALTSRLPGQMGRHLDMGDALGDLHEVAFTDTTRVFKTDASGNLPSAKTIARRLLGLAGKTKITLADLKDEAGAEVSKIYQQESNNIATEIQQSLPPVIFNEFLGLPYISSPQEIAKNNYCNLNLRLSGSVYEYYGNKIGDKEVIYRVWTKESWQEFLSQLELKKTCTAFTEFAQSPNQPDIIHIGLVPGQSETSQLRAFFEEQYHVIRGPEANSNHEFMAQLYAEAKLKELSHSHRSSEQVLRSVLIDYQDKSVDIENAVSSALTLVNKINLDSVFSGIAVDENYYYSFLEAVERGLEKGNKRRKEYRELLDNSGWQDIVCDLHQIIKIRPSNIIRLPLVVTKSNVRDSLGNNLQIAASNSFENFDINKEILSSPSLLADVNQAALQPSGFERKVSQLLEKVEVEQGFFNGVEKTPLKEIKELAEDLLKLSGDMESSNLVTATDLEKASFERMRDIYGKTLLETYRQFEQGAFRENDFKESVIKYLAHWNRIINFVRAEEKYGATASLTIEDSPTLPFPERFLIFRNQLRQREVEFFFSAFFSRASTASIENKNIPTQLDADLIVFNYLSGLAPMVVANEIDILCSHTSANPAFAGNINKRAAIIIRKISVIAATETTPAYLQIDFNQEISTGKNYLNFVITNFPVAAENSPLEQFMTALNSGFSNDLAKFIINEDTTEDQRREILEEIRELLRSGKILYQCDFIAQSNIDSFVKIANMLGRDEQERRAIYLWIKHELTAHAKEAEVEGLRRGLVGGDILELGPKTPGAVYNSGLHFRQNIRAKGIIDVQRKPGAAKILDKLKNNSPDNSPAFIIEQNFYYTLLSVMLAPVPVDQRNGAKVIKFLEQTKGDATNKWFLFTIPQIIAYYQALDTFSDLARTARFFEKLHQYCNSAFPESSTEDPKITKQLRQLFVFEVLYDVFEKILPNRDDSSFRNRRKEFWEFLVVQAEINFDCDLAESILWHLRYEKEKLPIQIEEFKNEISRRLLCSREENSLAELNSMIANCFAHLRCGYLMIDPQRPTVSLQNLGKPLIDWSEKIWDKTGKLDSQFEAVAKRLKSRVTKPAERLKAKNILLDSYFSFFEDLIAIREAYEAGRFEDALLVMDKYLRRNNGKVAEKAQFPDSPKKPTDSSWLPILREFQKNILEAKPESKTLASNVSEQEQSSELPNRPLEITAATTMSPVAEQALLVLPLVPTQAAMSSRMKTFFELVNKGNWLTNFLGAQIREPQEGNDFWVVHDSGIQPESSIRFILFHLLASECTYVRLPDHLQCKNPEIRRTGKFEALVTAQEFTSIWPGGQPHRKLRDFQNSINKTGSLEGVTLEDLRENMFLVLDEKNSSQRTAAEIIEQARLDNPKVLERILLALRAMYQERFEIFRLLDQVKQEIKITATADKAINKEQARQIVEQQIQRFKQWPRLRADWEGCLKDIELSNQTNYYDQLLQQGQGQINLTHDPNHFILPIDDLLTAELWQELFYPASRVVLKDFITETIEQNFSPSILLSQIIESVTALSRNERFTEMIVNNAKPRSNQANAGKSYYRQQASGVLALDKNNKPLSWEDGVGSHSGARHYYARQSAPQVVEYANKTNADSLVIVYNSSTALPSAVQLEVFLDDIRRIQAVKNVPIHLGVQTIDGKFYIYKLKDGCFSDAFAETFQIEIHCNEFVQKIYEFIVPPLAAIGNGQFAQTNFDRWAASCKSSRIKENLKSALMKSFPYLSEEVLSSILAPVLKDYQDEINRISAVDLSVKNSKYNLRLAMMNFGVKIALDLIEATNNTIFKIDKHFEPLVIEDFSTLPPAWVLKEEANSGKDNSVALELAKRAAAKRGSDTFKNETGQTATLEELTTFAITWVDSSSNAGEKNHNFPKLKKAWESFIKTKKKLRTQLENVPESITQLKELQNYLTELNNFLNEQEAVEFNQLYRARANAWAEQTLDRLESAIALSSENQIDLLIQECSEIGSFIIEDRLEVFTDFKVRAEAVLKAIPTLSQKQAENWTNYRLLLTNSPNDLREALQSLEESEARLGKLPSSYHEEARQFQVNYASRWINSSLANFENIISEQDFNQFLQLEKEFSALKEFSATKKIKISSEDKQRIELFSTRLSSFGTLRESFSNALNKLSKIPESIKEAQQIINAPIAEFNSRNQEQLQNSKLASVSVWANQSLARLEAVIFDEDFSRLNDATKDIEEICKYILEEAATSFSEQQGRATLLKDSSIRYQELGREFLEFKDRLNNVTANLMLEVRATLAKCDELERKLKDKNKNEINELRKPFANRWAEITLTRLETLIKSNDFTQAEQIGAECEEVCEFILDKTISPTTKAYKTRAEALKESLFENGAELNQRRAAILGRLRTAPETLEAMQLLVADSSALIQEFKENNKRDVEDLRSSCFETWVDSSMESRLSDLANINLVTREALEAACAEAEALYGFLKIEENQKLSKNNLADRIKNFKDDLDTYECYMGALELLTDEELTENYTFMDRISVITDFSTLLNEHMRIFPKGSAYREQGLSLINEQLLAVASSVNNYYSDTNTDNDRYGQLLAIRVLLDIASASATGDYVQRLSQLSKQMSARTDLWKRKEVTRDQEEIITRTVVYGGDLIAFIEEGTFESYDVGIESGEGYSDLGNLGFNSDDIAKIEQASTTNNQYQVFIGALNETIEYFNPENFDLEGLENPEQFRESLTAVQSSLIDALFNYYQRKIIDRATEVVDEDRLSYGGLIQTLSPILSRRKESLAQLRKKAERQNVLTNDREVGIAVGETLNFTLLNINDADITVGLKFTQIIGERAEFEVILPLTYNAFATERAVFRINNNDPKWFDPLNSDANQFAAKARRAGTIPKIQVRINPIDKDSKEVSNYLVIHQFEVGVSGNEKKFSDGVVSPRINPLDNLINIIRSSVLSLQVIELVGGMLRFKVVDCRTEEIKITE